MKKILLIASVAGLAMVSCKKDRTCECKTTSDAPGFTSSTTVYTVKKSKKTSDITANCVSYTSKQTAPTASTYYYGQDCELK
ncbi:MAG: hypothetical protein Q7W45_13255 [Bacteroidota bacterium]|nr:hypothetical protein [Bacteroidota bacterium]MDP3144512.1 hypothetical protein [Bacteroidota bacterium]MDP3555807.1 hypothetical protein [Bacteroidota bacterium]